MSKQINWKNIVLVLLDIVAVNVSYVIALYARLYGYTNVAELFHSYLSAFLQFAPFYTVFCLLAFHFLGLYRGVWRYAGMNDLNRIVIANVITCTVHILGTILFVRRMPLTYYFIGSAFQFFLVCAARLGYRVFLMEKAKIIRHRSPAENVMIIGNDPNTIRLIDYMENEKGKALRPVCILDDKMHVSGKLLNGVPIIGGEDKLEEGIEKYKVRNVFIVSSMIDNDFRKQLEEVCQERYLVLKDFSGYLDYLNNEEGLLDIVKAPETLKVSGQDKRIIPFSPPDIGEKEIGEVTEALKSGWITTGPRTKLLERRLAAYIETGKTDIDTETEVDRWKDRVVCLNSATAAEELNLRILGIREGDEVIVPAYTYTASASAAIHCGATVKLVDIQKDGDPVTHMPEMDYTQLEAAITEKTKAVVVVDLDDGDGDGCIIGLTKKRPDAA